MTAPQLEAGSFRDRTGRVFYYEGRVLRALDPEGLTAWEALDRRKFFPRLVEEGKIVSTHRVEIPVAELQRLGSEWVATLEHARIPFISYPYEWSFSMLRDAALLELELVRAALAEEMILKDASSYNVQWRGVQPVFIDVGSFEEWRPGDPWVGYLQFCQLFLYPLLLTSCRDVSFQPWLRGAIDGIAPREMSQLLTWRDLARPGVLTDVVLQARFLERGVPDNQKSTSLRAELRRAGFKKEMILHNIGRLEKIVGRLTWRRRSSQWADYAECNSYDEKSREAKERFVTEVAARRHWRLVWDLGANTGRFSRIAARHADGVVAFDADHLAVERFYQELQIDGPANVLPLVMNLTDVSPALGWRGRERRAFDQRSSPELTLCLALLHHLVIGANIPLPELVAYLAGLGSHLVVEFVAKDDPMVRHLLRNKADLYRDYALESFERLLTESFEVLERQELPGGTRTLYFARPREATG